MVSIQVGVPTPLHFRVVEGPPSKSGIDPPTIRDAWRSYLRLTCEAHRLGPIVVPRNLQAILGWWRTGLRWKVDTTTLLGPKWRIPTRDRTMASLIVRSISANFHCRILRRGQTYISSPYPQGYRNYGASCYLLPIIFS